MIWVSEDDVLNVSYDTFEDEFFETYDIFDVFIIADCDRMGIYSYFLYIKPLPP